MGISNMGPLNGRFCLIFFIYDKYSHIWDILGLIIYTVYISRDHIIAYSVYSMHLTPWTVNVRQLGFT